MRCAEESSKCLRKQCFGQIGAGWRQGGEQSFPRDDGGVKGDWELWEGKKGEKEEGNLQRKRDCRELWSCMFSAEWASATNLLGAGTI